MQTWDTIGIAIVSYLLGVLTGYYGASFFNDKLDLTFDNYKNLVLILVSMAWFASVLFELINPEFKTSVLIHGLMGAIVGFFFKKGKK